MYDLSFRRTYTYLHNRLGLLLALTFILAIAFTNSGNTAFVASAAGSNPTASCPDGQCFADVAAANPFYEFANRLYIQGLVSGYACGGPGEPCDADSRPYYRPGSAVTRQQMTKFIDNARRLPEIHIDASAGSSPVWVRNLGVGAIYGETNTGAAISGYSSGVGGTGVYGSGYVGMVGVSSPTSLEGGNVPSGAPLGPTGVAGYSNSEPHGFGVYGYGTGWGLYGQSNSDGTLAATGGVFGEALGVNSVGVLGKADLSSGSTFSVGVMGQSETGAGVLGRASGNAAGMIGANLGTGSGVVGQAASTGGFGVYGINSAVGGTAGYFAGDVQVLGNLSKGGGSFKIDHPLDPANKYLYHSFVESPDMMNIYNGNITTDAKGEAIVTMPDWFDALNRDFRYQLTPIGQFAQVIVAEEMHGNTFVIKSDKPNVKVSWQVTGIRQDPYANAHRIPVEQDKAPQDQGKYLYPTEQGQPESAQLGPEPVQLPEQTQGQTAK